MSPQPTKERGKTLENWMSIEEVNRLSMMKQVDKKILSLRKASDSLGDAAKKVEVKAKKCLRPIEDFKRQIGRKRG